MFYQFGFKNGNYRRKEWMLDSANIKNKKKLGKNLTAMKKKKEKNQNQKQNFSKDNPW